MKGSAKKSLLRIMFGNFRDILKDHEYNKRNIEEIEQDAIREFDDIKGGGRKYRRNIRP
ncbi:hypothetical protein [Sphingomonas sp. Leaf22]|uniref:hypothetical protein n=1 Tax=Sphingomonas sp. Leaf22 TaxID=1735687 RepID=UPI0012E285E1|nr:hypothetical protein [Sphingomonas sp. Leaf22]